MALTDEQKYETTIHAKYVEKTIHVNTDASFYPSDVARACRDMAVLCNAMVGAITMACGLEKPSAAGAASQATQRIFSAAIALEEVALMMEAPSRIAPAGNIPPARGIH